MTLVPEAPAPQRMMAEKVHVETRSEPEVGVWNPPLPLTPPLQSASKVVQVPTYGPLKEHYRLLERTILGLCLPK